MTQPTERASAAEPPLQVLVVDDEADIRALLQYNLARAGFEVVEAPDGLTAIARAQEHRGPARRGAAGAL